MTLTDLMSGSGLAWYAIAGLVLFFGAFIALCVWVWMPSHRTWWRDAARIPLDDNSPAAQDAL